jgi:hypothetical protein
MKVTMSDGPSGRFVLRGLQKISGVLCLLSLLGIFLLVGWTAWLSYRFRPWERNPQSSTVPTPQNANPAGVLSTATTASATLTADQKLQLQADVSQAQASLLAEVRTNDANDRLILDRLVTLVGVYSGILGLVAFVTLRLAREDARD